MDLIKYITVTILFLTMIIGTLHVLSIVGYDNRILALPVVVGCGLGILCILYD